MKLETWMKGLVWKESAYLTFQNCIHQESSALVRVRPMRWRAWYWPYFCRARLAVLRADTNVISYILACALKPIAIGPKDIDGQQKACIGTVLEKLIFWTS